MSDLEILQSLRESVEQCERVTSRRKSAKTRPSVPAAKRPGSYAFVQVEFRK